MTFAGGVDTGPAGTGAGDSLVCSPAPNGWHWTVTIPGPYTISYDFNSFPPGYLICGDIFLLRSEPQLDVTVDVEADVIEIRSGASAAIIYTGTYSEFDAASEGFRPIAAQRCGRYSLIYQGACCDFATAECVVTTQADCPFEWLGMDVPCNMETCPPESPPVGACCDHATGDCTITTEADCTFDWLGLWVPCDLTTCIPPVPTERQTWGRIKSRYR